MTSLAEIPNTGRSIAMLCFGTANAEKTCSSQVVLLVMLAHLQASLVRSFEVDCPAGYVSSFLILLLLMMLRLR